jgi:alkylation response protein AidB-like acyl-CoA dehydrogenase
VASATDIALAPSVAAFREELRDWLADHLVGEFKAAGAVGGPADDEQWELRTEWERQLVAGRWLNVSWPEEYGGRGGTFAQELIFHIEHAAACAPYWVGVQGRDLLGPTLLEFGSEDLKQRFLPPIARCEELWGQGFSEPGAGSDLAGLATRAERDGDEWVINGQKIWTTFGAHADWLYVLCRTNPVAQRHKGISMILVPVAQPGVEVRTIRNIAGGREFCEVFFDDARARADHVVGAVDGGWRVVMGALGNERSGATVLPFQASFRREMDALLTLVRQRRLDRDPLIRQRLARAWGGLRILELLNDRLFGAVLAGGSPGPESSIGKLYWSHWHRDFGELMVSVLGAEATVNTDDGHPHPMVRTFLNSRAETIYGGAAEIQRNIVGERVLGLPKEP